MGLASSSAVRVDEAYGSLGALGGGLGGGSGRTLKKKPVLVLDPVELAKAHQLFQIGAAEQLGDFDPKERVHRPAAALFNPIMGAATFHDDEDDEYIAPIDLASADPSDDEDEVDEDLPPIDLDSLLSLTRAEQEAEDAYYLAEPEYETEAEALAEPPVFTAPEPEPEVEPELAGEPAPLAIDVQAEPESFTDELLPQAKSVPVAETASPSDALARIISRAAAQPKPAPEPEAEATLFQPEPEPEIAVSEPARFEPDLPELDAAPIRAFDPAPEPVAEEQPLDLSPQDEFDGEAFVRPEAPLRVLPILGDAAPRSQLRARLMREDLTLARPEPGLWRRMVLTLRRWRYSLPF